MSLSNMNNTSIATPVNRQFYSLPVSAESDISSKCLFNDPNRSSGNTDRDANPRNHHENGYERGHRDTTQNLLTVTNHDSQNSGLLSYIQGNVVGSEKIFSGPFGLRSALYLDYVASGRALKFIEDYIHNEVLPEYGNTHTTTSFTSLQTTLFRHEARDIVRNACNASEHDSVIFVGTGTTGAVHKLIHNLQLSGHTVVFTGPYEHHSNILPWVQAGAKVIRISETSAGSVDIYELEECLKMLKNFQGQIIGAFSAASNVTGVLTNVNDITSTLHKYGALAFWDYATAAPYVKIDMNPYIGGVNQHLVYKDAIYFSVHKFVGGVDSPGVLIAKKSVFRNASPDGCGGGTVFYVRRDSQRYLQEPEMREEGGTPGIIGSIRAGLVFQLKENVGTDIIHSRDANLIRQAMDAWSNMPNLLILGPSPESSNRLPIFSFLVHHPLTGRFLHYNFVAAILNDLFGIQSRGGCACAGPYSMDLLGLSESVSEKLESLLAEDSKLDRVHLRRIGEYSHREIIRPGFVRINLPYFLDQGSIDFVLKAVKLVAEHAWKLLPQYLFNPETGEWRHKQFQTFKDRKWLGHISYASGKMSYHQPALNVKGPLPKSYQKCIDAANEIFAQAEKIKMKLPDQSLLFDDEAKPFRWFVLPSEAYDCLQQQYSQEPLKLSDLPFCPPDLFLKLGYKEPSSNKQSAIQKVKTIVQNESQFESDSNHNDRTPPFQSHVGNKIPFTSSASPPALDISETKSVKESFSRELAKTLEQGFMKSEKEGKTNIHDDKIIGDGLDREKLIHQTLNSSYEIKESIPENKIKSENVPHNLKSQCDMIQGQKILNMNEANKAEAQIPVTSENHILFLEEDEGTDDRSHAAQSKENRPAGMDVKSSMKNRRKCNWFSPPKIIFKPTVSALEEYNMLQDGDKVLICLSGGKDSLSLLHTIHQYQFYAKGKGIKFEFGAVTIDPQTPSYDPSPLKDYLASLGVPYFYESQCIMETANNLPYECASICSFCSRMKRGRIYAAARREGYNVLALGQHLDDLSESFMMSFLHNGVLNTMKAHYTVKEGDLRVIRPFIYVREVDLRSFAEKNKLPVIAENCPACFEAPKERHRIKQLLAAQEVMFPQVYNSMLSAMKPLVARERQSGYDIVRGSRDTEIIQNKLIIHDNDFDE